MKKSILICSFALFAFTACEEGGLGEIAPPLTNEEVISGLKSALEVGTDNAVNVLNARDGYYKDEAVKIFLPPEADVIIDHLEMIP